MARSMLHRRTFERATTLPVLLLPLPGEGWDGGTHDADSIPPLASAFFAGYPSGKNAGATIYYKKRSCSRSIYMGYSSKILDIQRKPTQDNRHSREGGNPEDQEPTRVAVCFPSGNIWRERFSRQARQLRRPARPILFDMDGDGTKHATGWVAAGEAIVVRDINGNGLIDSGRELFGDATLLTRGLRAGQNAANGFEALADLDLDANGISDGKFDANDVAYSSVKLWQDTNQDGMSQAGELRTFTESGVASINVSGTASNINLGGGNTQAFTGSFTRTNGQAGTAGTAELAGSLLLAVSNVTTKSVAACALKSAVIRRLDAKNGNHEYPKRQQPPRAARAEYLVYVAKHTYASGNFRKSIVLSLSTFVQSGQIRSFDRPVCDN